VAPLTGSAGLKESNVATIVFHGDGDRTVNPVNGDQVFAQRLQRALGSHTRNHQAKGTLNRKMAAH
jgi:hypothetical protein